MALLVLRFVMRVLVLVGLLLAARPCAGQTARLVLRDGGPVGVAEADGPPSALGRELLELGPGSVTEVAVVQDALSGVPDLVLQMSAPTAAAFADVTREAVGRTVALVLDGRVLIAPTVREAITGGQVQISGPFSLDEIEAFAAAIQDATGARPRARPPAKPSMKRR